MGRQKFFIRLLKIYILIMGISALAIMAVFLYMSGNIISLESRNNKKEFLQQVGVNIDTQLNTAFGIANEVMADKEVQKYIRSINPEPDNILKVQQKLDLSQSAFTTLEYPVALSKLYDDLIISASKTSSILHHFEDIGVNDIEIKDIEDALMGQQNINSYFTLRSQITDGISIPRRFLTIVKKNSSDINNLIYTFFTLDEQRLLPKLSSPKEAFIILRNDQIITVETDLELEIINELFTEDVMNKMKMNADSSIDIDTSEYKIMYMNSNFIDWKYVYVFSKNNFKIKNLAYKCLFIYVLLVFFITVLSFLITRKVYTPINNIVKLFKQFSDNTIHDDLPYIQETSMKIININNELRQLVKNQTIPLKVKFIKDILFGLLPKQEIEEKLEKYQLDNIDGIVTVVIVELTNYQELFDEFSKEAVINIQGQLIEYIRNTLEKNILFEILELDNRKVAIIFNGANQNRIKMTFNQVLSTIEEDFSLNIVVAIGESVDSIFELDRSFYSAMHILEFKIDARRNSVVTVNDFAPGKIDYYYPLDLERDLISYTVRGKWDQVNSILYRLLDENLIQRNSGKETVDFFTFALAATINRIIHVLGKSADDFYEKGTIPYAELKMCKNADELKQKILIMFNTIISKTNHEVEKADNTLANDIVTYVNQNYFRDISLENLAQHFELSQGYISRSFRNFAGQSFKDYLNSYRVKKAKEILTTDPNIKIKELAEIIGFNSASSFIRMFNKYEGVTPGKFIKKNN